MADSKPKAGSKWMAVDLEEGQDPLPGLNPGIVVEVAAVTDDAVIFTYYDQTAVAGSMGNDMAIGSVPRNVALPLDQMGRMKKTTKPVHNKPEDAADV